MLASCGANAAAGKARDHMAKEVVNKSAAIRDALKKFPKKTPLEISAYLKAEQGLDVPAQYISTVKFNMKAKKSARKLTKKVEANGSGDAEALYAAAQLVVKAGGVEQARLALAAVAKVASIIE